MNRFVNWLMLKMIWWLDRDLRKRNRAAMKSLEILKR